MNFSALDDAVAVDSGVAALFSTLWSDPGLQQAYARRSEFQLYDSFEYFANRIDVIAQDDYVASVQVRPRLPPRATRDKAAALLARRLE